MQYVLGWFPIRWLTGLFGVFFAFIREAESGVNQHRLTISYHIRILVCPAYR